MYTYFSRAARFFDQCGQASMALEYYEKTCHLILRAADTDIDFLMDGQYLTNYFFLLHKTGHGEGAFDKVKDYFKDMFSDGGIAYFLPPYNAIIGFGMDLEAVSSILKQLHQEYPEALEVIDQMFYMKLIQKEYEACNQLLEQAIRLASEENQPGYLNNLGYVYLLQGEFEKAKAFFEKVIILDSSMSGYHGIDQGVTFYLDGKLKFSAADFFGNPTKPLSPGLFNSAEPVQVAAANLCAANMIEGNFDQAFSTTHRFMGIFLKQSALAYEFIDRALKSMDSSSEGRDDGLSYEWTIFEQSMAIRTHIDFDLPTLVLFSLAMQRKDKVTARWIWNELIENLPDRKQDVDFFSKTHPELYAWLIQD